LYHTVTLSHGGAIPPTGNVDHPAATTHSTGSTNVTTISAHCRTTAAIALLLAHATRIYLPDYRPVSGRHPILAALLFANPVLQI
jgi:hypothetical protein